MFLPLPNHPSRCSEQLQKHILPIRSGMSRKDLVVVSIMPCLAKKYECQRDEFSTITTGMLTFQFPHGNWPHSSNRPISISIILKRVILIHPLGESTGAGVIFGATGGVIEAAVRTAYEFHTGKKLERLDFTELRGMEGVREATIDFDGLPLRSELLMDWEMPGSFSTMSDQVNRNSMPSKSWPARVDVSAEADNLASWQF